MLDARLLALIVCGMVELLFCRVIYSQRKLGWQRYHIDLLAYVGFGLAWTIGTALMLFARDPTLIQIGVGLFTVAPMLATHYIVLYSYSFLKVKPTGLKLFSAVSWIFIIMATLVCLTNVSRIYILYPPSPYGINTLEVVRGAYIAYSVYFIVLFQIAYINHIRSLRSTKDIETRKKFLYSYFAILFVGLVGMVSNLGVPSFTGSLDIAWLGPLVGLVYVITSTYAIVTYRLFNVRTSAFRALGYSLSIIILVTLYSLLIYGVIFPIISPGTQFEFSILLLILGGTVITIYLYDKVKIIFDAITDKLFFKNSYSLPHFLDELNRALIDSTDVGDLADSIMKVMGENLKTEYFVLVIKQGRFETTIDSRRKESLRETDAKLPMSLVNYHFKSETRVVLRDYMNKNKFSGLYEMLDEKDFSAAIDLSEASKTTSSLKKALESGNYKTMLLGPKRSGESYNAQDLDALEIISKELVIALQNAMRFEEIKLFNLELQHKVDLATIKLRQQNKKLVVADELKDDFLSIASHQMRTPISTINGYASILNSGDAGKLSGDQQKFAKIIESSTKRLSYLINDFLTVSRLKSGKFDIEKNEADLKSMLKSEAASLEDQFKSKDVKLWVNIDAHIPKTNVDEQKLRQVMMNLIDNALHYTEKDGKVEVTLKQDGRSVVFEVKDNGIGVPKESQAELFSKMFRADNAKKMRPDGTGLGLYLAKKVVVAHNGHIIFKSKEGEGSTFGFKIPIK